MSSLYNQLCDELGINAKTATQLPLAVTKQAFFDRLAQHGIAPRSEAEAQAMLEASDRLETKAAAIAAENDPVARALGIIVGSKTAAAPVADNDLQRKQAAAEYTRALMSNPEAYAGLLVNVTAN